MPCKDSKPPSSRACDPFCFLTFLVSTVDQSWGVQRVLRLSLLLSYIHILITHKELLSLSANIKYKTHSYIRMHTHRPHNTYTDNTTHTLVHMHTRHWPCTLPTLIFSLLYRTFEFHTWAFAHTVDFAFISCFPPPPPLKIKPTLYRIINTSSKKASGCIQSGFLFWSHSSSSSILFSKELYKGSVALAVSPATKRDELPGIPSSTL